VEAEWAEAFVILDICMILLRTRWKRYSPWLRFEIKEGVIDRSGRVSNKLVSRCLYAVGLLEQCACVSLFSEGIHLGGK